MQLLAKNMRARKADLKLSEAQLAERVGISQPMIHKLLKGKAKGTSHLLAIAKALNCKAEDLVSETDTIGEPAARYLSPTDSNATLIDTPHQSMPLISWVSAGVWCESPDTYAPGDAEEWLPKPANAGPRSFALRVDGDSMTSPYPGGRSYPSGTIIYVDPDKDLTNGCRVVARANGEYTFKCYAEDAGRKFLKPLNPQYQMIDVTDDTHICGVVIGSYLPE